MAPKEKQKEGNNSKARNDLAEVHEEQLRGHVLGGSGIHGGGQCGFFLRVALDRQIPHRELAIRA